MMIATENISFAPFHIVSETSCPAALISSLTITAINAPATMNNIDNSAKYHHPSCATSPNNRLSTGTSSNVYSGIIPKSFQGMNRSTINTNAVMKIARAAF